MTVTAVSVKAKTGGDKDSRSKAKLLYNKIKDDKTSSI